MTVKSLCGVVGTAGYPCTREVNHGDPEGNPTFNHILSRRHVARNDQGIVMQIWQDEEPR